MDTATPSAETVGFRETVADFLGVILPQDFVLTHPCEFFLDRVAIQVIMVDRPPFYVIERAALIGNTVWAAAPMPVERCEGHFPGNPVIPLIRFCEVMAQTGMIVVASLYGSKDVSPVALGCSKAKPLTGEFIKAPARLLVKADLVNERSGVYMVDAKVFHQGSPIATLAGIPYSLLSRRELLSAR